MKALEPAERKARLTAVSGARLQITETRVREKRFDAERDGPAGFRGDGGGRSKRLLKGPGFSDAVVGRKKRDHGARVFPERDGGRENRARRGVAAGGLADDVRGRQAEKL